MTGAEQRAVEVPSEYDGERLDTFLATGEKPPLPFKRKIPARANPWPKGRKLQSRSSFERRAP